MYLQNKSSIKADGVGDLYRCADKLAKGKIEVGMMFYRMAIEKIGTNELKLEKDKVMKDNLYWAEMVLDEYMRLKRVI